MKRISEKIRERCEAAGQRYYANDNIAKFVLPEEKEEWIEEIAREFDIVLQALVIDIYHDPNSIGTGQRLAKMYVNELFEGRYNEQPCGTAFPNVGEEKYTGMLVVRAELTSVCSHHHQPVKGVAYIGIIPNEQVIGLSKYIRLAQWCARRGTLQEQLCNDIARTIMKATGAPDVAVYLAATHGCCENRGVMAKSSLTQTTVLHGEFNNSDVKKEFFDNIKLQERFAE
jgi:GTP cyclohydrolase IA